MKPGLLILDPQNDFFESDNPNLAEFQRVIPVINNDIDIFRERQLPIIFIQGTSAKKAAGTTNWEIYKGFDRRPEDTCLEKTYSNAFWKSKLGATLKSLHINYVVIAGFVAEYCVLSTYRGAKERGYQAVILQDAIASVDDNQRIQFVLDISNNIPLCTLTEQLDALK